MDFLGEQKDSSLKNNPKEDMDSHDSRYLIDTGHSSVEGEKIKSNLTENEQKEEYIVYDKEGFIYNPYDFPLEANVIEALLGNNVEINEKYVQSGEFDEGYVFTQITYGDTKLSFYDYEGKHRAKITTPKLPLKNGIRIGMSKQNFIKAMKFDGDKAQQANLFTLEDEGYGTMSFYFSKDILYLIDGYYEEGD